MASVVGNEVPFVLLREIAARTEDQLHGAISHLQEAEFLYEAGHFPDLEYTFKHALTHDVTYGSLLQDRRRTLHAQILAAIERLYADRLTEHIERAAHHAVRAETWEKAVIYLRQAGAKAYGRSANREALAFFERALIALTHLSETRETREQAIDVRFDLRNALLPLAEFGTIDRYLREAEILARGLNDQRRLGWAWWYMSGHPLFAGGHASEAQTLVKKVEAIGEALPDVPLQIAAQDHLVLACYVLGDYREVEHVSRRMMRLLQGDRAREHFGLAVFPAVMSRAFLAAALAERGVFDEGAVHGQEAIRIAETLDHPYSLIVACHGLAYLSSVRGELSHADQLLERAIVLSRDWNITLWTPIVMASLGHVYASTGRVAEGVSLLQQGLTAYESAGIGLLHSLSVVQLGEAYLLADEVREARSQADRAVVLARQRGERGWEARTLRLLGEIASHHKNPDLATAEAHYGAAAALASELEMRPLLAHCHLGLCRLYCQTGKREQAHEALTTATAMYRDMNMQFWLQHAEAETQG
jgi:tetratricopeptide (TPR) repeat protein